MSVPFSRSNPISCRASLFLNRGWSYATGRLWYFQYAPHRVENPFCNVADLLHWSDDFLFTFFCYVRRFWRWGTMTQSLLQPDRARPILFRLQDKQASFCVSLAWASATPKSYVHIEVLIRLEDGVVGFMTASCTNLFLIPSFEAFIML